MTQTLTQIRAANALAWKDRDFGGKNEGNIVSGFPMLIKTAGLLPALAYALELKERREENGQISLAPKNKGEFVIAIAVFHHLVLTGILTDAAASAELNDTLARLTPASAIGAQFKAVAEGFLRELTDATDASQLRRATAEALAFLSYLKRFVA
jgi:hypothetical protein